MKIDRSISGISMMNPLICGDTLDLDGAEGSRNWTVKQGGFGWQLRDSTTNDLHPTIKDISGMSDFIGAILEVSKSSSKI